MIWIVMMIGTRTDMVDRVSFLVPYILTALGFMGNVH